LSQQATIVAKKAKKDAKKGGKKKAKTAQTISMATASFMLKESFRKNWFIWRKP